MYTLVVFHGIPIIEALRSNLVGCKHFLYAILPIHLSLNAKMISPSIRVNNNKKNVTGIIITALAKISNS